MSVSAKTSNIAAPSEPAELQAIRSCLQAVGIESLASVQVEKMVRAWQGLAKQVLSPTLSQEQRAIWDDLVFDLVADAVASLKLVYRTAADSGLVFDLNSTTPFEAIQKYCVPILQTMQGLATMCNPREVSMALAVDGLSLQDTPPLSPTTPPLCTLVFTNNDGTELSLLHILGTVVARVDRGRNGMLENVTPVLRSLASDYGAVKLDQAHYTYFFTVLCKFVHAIIPPYYSPLCREYEGYNGRQIELVSDQHRAHLCDFLLQILGATPPRSMIALLGICKGSAGTEDDDELLQSQDEDSLTPRATKKLATSMLINIYQAMSTTLAPIAATHLPELSVILTECDDGAVGRIIASGVAYLIAISDVFAPHPNAIPASELDSQLVSIIPQVLTPAFRFSLLLPYFHTMFNLRDLSVWSPLSVPATAHAILKHFIESGQESFAFPLTPFLRSILKELAIDIAFYVTTCPDHTERHAAYKTLFALTDELDTRMAFECLVAIISAGQRLQGIAGLCVARVKQQLLTLITNAGSDDTVTKQVALDDIRSIKTQLYIMLHAVLSPPSNGEILSVYDLLSCGYNMLFVLYARDTNDVLGLKTETERKLYSGFVKSIKAMVEKTRADLSKPGGDAKSSLDMTLALLGGGGGAVGSATSGEVSVDDAGRMSDEQRDLIRMHREHELGMLQVTLERVLEVL